MDRKPEPTLIKIKGLFQMTADESRMVIKRLEEQWERAMETGRPLILGDGVDLISGAYVSIGAIRRWVDEWGDLIDGSALADLGMRLLEEVDDGM
jgi:hypothetical protein